MHKKSFHGLFQSRLNISKLLIQQTRTKDKCRHVSVTSYWRFWTESGCAASHKERTLVTIIPHPQAIISNALDYILLIVDSSDPNLS